MRGPLDGLAILFGAAAVGAVLSDVFQSVVVPRAVGQRFRLSIIQARLAWKLWPTLAWRFYGSLDDKREDFLATFAPFSLIMTLSAWSFALLLGYGALFWGMRAWLAPALHTYGQAVYFAGISFLTIGYGDIVPTHAMTRALAICAGASGLSVFSLTTAFLFAIFGAFQQREAFVVVMGARSGSPPSGIDLLVIAAETGSTDSLGLTMREGLQWAAHVMESHLAYPILAYFRSSHDYESWIGTLGTLLDASVLMITTIAGSDGDARIFYNLGRHAAHDLARYFNVGTATDSPGIERSEFDHAYERLEHAGYTLNDRDESWQRFSQLRSTYAAHLAGLARFFQIPPLRWIGDRSTVRTH